MADNKRPETPVRKSCCSIPQTNGGKDTTAKGSHPPSAESPTTARELDFEDDLQENPAQNNASAAKSTGKLTSVPTSDPPKPDSSDEAPPPQPPRPLGAQQEAENTLKEAFPGIESAVVKAVLIASGGKIEPAFNALLGEHYCRRLRRFMLITPSNVGSGC